jgi:hypothetical protein
MMNPLADDDAQCHSLDVDDPFLRKSHGSPHRWCCALGRTSREKEFEGSADLMWEHLIGEFAGSTNDQLIHRRPVGRKH